MQENIEQYRDRYINAPPHIQEIMSSVETGRIMSEIGKRYQLDDEKIKRVAYQTGLILLNMSDFTSLYMKLKEILEVSEDTAINIANDINKQILYQERENPVQVQNRNQSAAEGVRTKRKGEEHVQQTQDRNKVAQIKRNLEQNKTERLADVLKDVD